MKSLDELFAERLQKLTLEHLKERLVYYEDLVSKDKWYKKKLQMVKTEINIRTHE